MSDAIERMRISRVDVQVGVLIDMAVEIERLRADNSRLMIAEAAIDACRKVVREGLGVESSWVDNNARLVVALAQRAVLAGLDTDGDPETVRKMSLAAEVSRYTHEKALGRELKP